MVWLGLISLWLSDSIPGIVYQWMGLSETKDGICAVVRIQAASRPLYFVWQESSTGGAWVDIQRVNIDRWALPGEYRICRSQGQPGSKVRLVLRGLTSQSPQAILYEGYLWGEPPLPPEISIENGKPYILRVVLSSAGAYILRAYNRFGEEIFTIPVEATSSQEFKYFLPEAIRGALLIQLYSLSSRQILIEKAFRL